MPASRRRKKRILNEVCAAPQNLWPVKNKPRQSPRVRVLYTRTSTAVPNPALLPLGRVVRGCPPSCGAPTTRKRSRPTDFRAPSPSCCCLLSHVPVVSRWHLCLGRIVSWQGRESWSVRASGGKPKSCPSVSALFFSVDKQAAGLASPTSEVRRVWSLLRGKQSKEKQQHDGATNAARAPGIYCVCVCVCVC